MKQFLFYRYLFFLNEVSDIHIIFFNIYLNSRKKILSIVKKLYKNFIYKSNKMMKF